MIMTFRPIWPLVALLVSAALLAGAHAFETFGHMAPCVMCLQQREVHWWILGLAAAAFIAVRLRPNWARPAAFVLGLAFLVSVFFAGRHVAVEQHWIPAQCEAGKIDPNALRFDVHATITMPRCDVPAWSMFAITMAGYNALISLAMVTLSFVLAFAPMRKKADA